MFKRYIMVMMLLFWSVVVGYGQEKETLRVNWGNIVTFDSALATDTPSIQIIVELFPSLTRIDLETQAAEEGMAKAWTVSDDGLTYTFSLIEDVPWVRYNEDEDAVEQVFDERGNPRYVTAKDFQYGMLASMNPTTGSYYGGILSGWVSGGEAYHNAITTDEAALRDLAGEVAITVIDDYTLEIVATQPAGFLPSIFGMWMGAARPAWLEEEHGDDWTDADTLESYGPYVLAEWREGERLTLLRNPFWNGTDTMPVPAINEITGEILNSAAALANYEVGLLDTVSVPTEELDRILADDTLSTEYTTAPDTCTFYLMFNTTIAPTDDVRVRRALSLATDREAISESISRPSEPAYFFSRPGLAAAPTAEAFPEFVIGEDDEEAAALIAEYIAENGDLETMTFMHSAGSISGNLTAQATVEMWTDAIGADIDVDILSQEWAVFLETTDFPDLAPNIWYLGWCLDYPDTNNFLFDVLHSSVAQNGSGWVNEEFDALVAEAQILTDIEEREALYAQAENILTNEDVIMIPLVYDQQSFLTRPYVKRPVSGLSYTHYELWSLADF